MAVAPADLQSPNGPLTAKLFPGEQGNVRTARFTAYIARAAADARVVNEPAADKKDPITRALALHFAFTDVYVRMSAEPLTTTITEKGGHGYSVEQIKNMRTLADQYLADATALLTVVSTTIVSPNAGAVSTNITW